MSQLAPVQLRLIAEMMPVAKDLADIALLQAAIRALPSAQLARVA